jgi:hypothetical protein
MRYLRAGLSWAGKAVSACRVLIAAAGLLMSATAMAQTFPPQYVNALQRTAYSIFTGDVNNDGYPDLLAKAKIGLVMIDMDVLVPIVLKPASATFVLLSQSGGSYVLSPNPSAATVGSSAWRPATYTQVFGDVMGTGSVALLLQARTPGSPSFLITTSASNGEPSLLQELTTAGIGYDLSASGITATLSDTNRDGRADLTIRSNGLIEAVLTASQQGTFARPSSDMDQILVAWRSFCAALDSGDVNSAARFISIDGQDTYVPVLRNLGSTLRTVTIGWSQPKAINMGGNFALYGIHDSTGTGDVLHMIVFMREDGRWLLSEF